MSRATFPEKHKGLRFSAPFTQVNFPRKKYVKKPTEQSVGILLCSGSFPPYNTTAPLATVAGTAFMSVAGRLANKK